MHQSAFFPTYGAYGADLAPGFYVGPGGWVYEVKSPTDVTVVWSPQTQKDLNQHLSGDTASKAYAELQDRKQFTTAAEAKAAAAQMLSYSPDPNAPLSAPSTGMAPSAPGAAGQGGGMGRKRGGKRRGGAVAPAAPAATSPWLYVGIGAVVLLAVGGIAYAASRK